MELNVFEMIVALIGAMLFLSPLLLWAYQQGIRNAATGKSASFNQIQVDVRMNDTHWKAEFDNEDAQLPPRVALIHIRQTGARIFGEGQFGDGALHSFEGVIAGLRVSYVSLDDSTQTRANDLGGVVLELDPDGRRMTGFQSRWNGSAQNILLRKVVFTQVNSLVPLS